MASTHLGAAAPSCSLSLGERAGVRGWFSPAFRFRFSLHHLLLNGIEVAGIGPDVAVLDVAVSGLTRPASPA